MFGLIRSGGYIKKTGFCEMSPIGDSILDERGLYHVLGVGGDGGTTAKRPYNDGSKPLSKTILNRLWSQRLWKSRLHEKFFEHGPRFLCIDFNCSCCLANNICISSVVE